MLTAEIRFRAPCLVLDVVLYSDIPAGLVSLFASTPDSLTDNNAASNQKLAQTHVCRLPVITHMVANTKSQTFKS